MDASCKELLEYLAILEYLEELLEGWDKMTNW